MKPRLLFYFVHRSELPAMAETDPDEGYVALVDADRLAASEARVRELSDASFEAAEREAKLIARVRELEDKLTKQVDVNYEIARKLPTRNQLLAALRELVEAIDTIYGFHPEGSRIWEALAKARALLDKESK